MVIDGFYDDDGVYKIRFMPDSLGRWSYTTDSNSAALKGRTGGIEVIAPGAGNRGPVRVRDTFHFGYADGTPYFPFGTTCYAWVHQSEERQQETLTALKTSPFNKIRMCIFPKWYQYNHGVPPRFPFPREGDTNDYSRFNADYFRHIESRILDLRAINIETDLILFHPYDHWGYQEMPAEVDDRYLRYVVARFSAYRNVWWSLANEYDLMRKKNSSDWERYAACKRQDRGQRELRSRPAASRPAPPGVPASRTVLLRWPCGRYADSQERFVRSAASWPALSCIGRDCLQPSVRRWPGRMSSPRPTSRRCRDAGPMALPRAVPCHPWSCRMR